MGIEKEIKDFKGMVNSYKITYILIAANNLKIFDALDEKSKSLENIADQININSDRIEPILNALTHYKLIRKDENGYFLDEYKDILNKNSRYNQLGYLEFAKTILERYENLENAIKNPEQSKNNFRKLVNNNSSGFLKGMNANAITQAKFIIDNYNFENHKILDVGAGAGTYSIQIAKKYKNAEVLMIDLPEMSKLQKEIIEKENLTDSIKLMECDYNNKFPNESFDDILAFAIIHQEPIERLEKLIKNMYINLKPGGNLFITSFFLEDDKLTPEFAVQFSVEMLVSSNNGRVYTHNEIKRIIKSVGFKNVERIDEIPGPATLYIAHKE